MFWPTELINLDRDKKHLSTSKHAYCVVCCISVRACYKFSCMSWLCALPSSHAYTTYWENNYRSLYYMHARSNFIHDHHDWTKNTHRHKMYQQHFVRRRRQQEEPAGTLKAAGGTASTFKNSNGSILCSVWETSHLQRESLKQQAKLFLFQCQIFSDCHP